MIALRRSTLLADTRKPMPIAQLSVVRVGGADADATLEGATTVADVDRIVRSALKNGNIPDYLAKDYWPGRRIEGSGHTLDILIAPDYGAIGDDSDPMRIGKESQTLAQAYADHYYSILPSQKLLRDIEASADIKIPFQAAQKDGRADDSVEGVIRANDLANAAFKKYGASNTDGKLKIGYKKSYVVRPGLDGKYLAIYGGRWTPSGGLVQPTSGHAHTEGYSDYSHGATLISRKAKLDGSPVDLRDVFLSRDPAIVALVSDEGRFDPVFPNGSSGVRDGITGGGEVIGTTSGSKQTVSAIPGGSPTAGIEVSASKPLVIAGAIGLAVLSVWLLT